MLAEFQVIPIGAGESLGAAISQVVKRVDESGLPYKVNPMGTVIEGEWSEVMQVIHQCHQAVLGLHPRIVTHITLDDRPGAQNRLDGKVQSVEKRLGRPVRQ